MNNLRLVFVVATSAGNWGKSDNLLKALAAANLELERNIFVRVVAGDNLKPEDVVVHNDGGLSCPTGSIVVDQEPTGFSAAKDLFTDFSLQTYADENYQD